MEPISEPGHDLAASTHLSKHRVHGLFPLSFQGSRPIKDGKSLDCLSELVMALTGQELVDRLRLANPDVTMPLDKALWQPMDGKGMALDDFYPHVRQILGAKPEGERLCLSYTLNSRALCQISGGKPRQWQIPLGKAAQRRAEADRVYVQIDGARLFAFNTGIAILDLFWSYAGVDKTLPLAHLLEGNYVLTHHTFPNNMPGTPVENTLSAMTAQVLRDVAGALLPESSDISLHGGRLIIYTQALLAESAAPESLRQIGIWLSHRQTTDYGPTAKAVGSALLEPFPYLCHVLAPEGAASVIFDKGMTSDFAKGFVTSGAQNIYVPLYLDSLHTHFWLLEQTDWLPARAEDDRQETESLDNLYARVVQFRRYFYFPMVSHIGLHNAFYQSSQSAFGIAERMRFLEQTSHDVAELLKVRRRKFLEPASGAVAGFIVGHELMGALSQVFTPDMRVWLIETAHAPPAALQSLVQKVEWWDLCTFIGSLICSLVGFWFVRKFGKPK